jgi:hypothetical protein
MRSCRALALVCSQLALLGLLLEGLGRAIDPLGVSYYPETARFFDRMILEEPLGYRLPPDLDERFWGVAVRTNSLGLRERELPAVKPHGEVRVMLLGDSVVFSLGVEYEDSIPAQLERALNEQAPAGTRYRTLNMGVPSYNTEQQLAQLESLGLGLAPDAVALFFATNDIEPKLWVFERRRSRLADCAQRSYAASIAAVLFQRLRSQRGETDPRVRYASFEPGNPRWEAVAAALRRIAELLRGRDIPFLVVAPGPDDAPHLQLLRGVGSAAGFAVEQLDGASDPRWAAEPARFVNSATDRHCNALGCRIIAEKLAQLLRRDALL